MPKFVMSDGRFTTSYYPSCDLEKSIQDKYNIKNSHEYRLFLQKNAEKLIKELSETDEGKGCNICPVCQKALDYKP